MQEILKNIFLYHDKNPLLFTQLYFWGFFIIVLSIFSLIYKNRTRRNAWLFIASLFFYYKTSGFFFSILLFSTITDFFIAKGIYSSKTKISKKLLVALSISINILVLAFFKYADFFVDNFNLIFDTNYQPINIFAQWTNSLFSSHFTVDKILLPVGISFYTFQTISYSIDVFKEKIKPVKSILDFGFYVSFFPQLVAGPIVRAADFVPQLFQDFKLTRREFGHALFLILNGLIKKVIIGDYIAVNFIDRVFSNPTMHTGFENLMALYGYSLQVYADFSGYTDIAIGLALLMGFRLPVNFNSPYKATNVGDFWKRWHISLSSWLKDYLYIPMGGNKKATAFTYIALAIILFFIVILSGWILLPFILAGAAVIIAILAILIKPFRKWFHTNINIMVTMLIGGLWHGSSWMFVIWGGLNGLGIVVYKLWRKISPWEGKKNFVVRFWTIFLTFNFITFTRIFFRGDSLETAQKIMTQISTNFGYKLAPEIIWGFSNVFIVMFIGYLVHWLPVSVKELYRGAFIKLALWAKLVVAVIIVFVLYQFHTSEMQAFIYFQF